MEAGYSEDLTELARGDGGRGEGRGERGEGERGERREKGEG